MEAPKLTRDDELALVAEFRTGSERGRAWARDQLFAFCWPMVLRIAHGRGSRNRDDLVQAGAVGVMRGLASFDPTKQVRVRTYVEFWVRKEVRAHIMRNRSAVHVTGWAQRQGVEHPDTEHDTDSVPDDAPSPEDAVAARQALELVAQLPSRERHVLLARADGATLEQAAWQLGVTRQRAWQLEQSGLATLRKLAGVSAVPYSPRDASRPATALRQPQTSRHAGSATRAA